MRSLAILLVLVAGGCSSQARPAPGNQGGRVIAAIERAARDVCRCRDGLCADAVVQQLGTQLGTTDAMLTTGEQSAMVHAVARLDRCRARLIRRGEQAARVAERWADETCNCPDADCMTVVARRGADELRRYSDVEPSDEDVRRIVLASRRVKSCLHSAGLVGTVFTN
jgi:hypothetical protein